MVRRSTAPSHPGLVGHDRLRITGSKIVGDGRSLFLEMPDLQPVNQLHLRLRVDAGKPCELFATVHALDKPFADFPGYQPVAKTVAAHPLLADMVTLSKPAPPNPWRDAIADAQPVTIEAGKNLTFATRTVAVPAGKIDQAHVHQSRRRAAQLGSAQAGQPVARG